MHLARRHTQTELTRIDSSSMHRRLTVKPAMCGHNSLLVGRIGDWTWETVGALCGTDVFRAKNESGAPTYLAFYYFHIQASPTVHLRRFGFGDRLDVVSKVFNFGSESILTLHRIEKAAGLPNTVGPIDAVEFYDEPREDCLYVENFNRWISRSRDGDNTSLVKSSPRDFKYAHLPTLPDRYSPRSVYDKARNRRTFLDPSSRAYSRLADPLQVDYAVDITRDINGVGLLYFAAFFSIIDGCLLKLWRKLGRSDRSFMERVMLDQKLCYLGNADVDSHLRITVCSRRLRNDRKQEVFDVVVEDRKTFREIAISTMHIRREPIHEATA